MRAKPDQDPKAVGRRDFLRGLGAGAVGGAAAVAATAPLTSEALADSENNDEKRKARYKANSDDVKAYYRVNRYPG
jgi:gas vesicle protein